MSHVMIALRVLFVMTVLVAVFGPKVWSMAPGRRDVAVWVAVGLFALLVAGRIAMRVRTPEALPPSTG